MKTSKQINIKKELADKLDQRRRIDLETNRCCISYSRVIEIMFSEINRLRKIQEDYGKLQIKFELLRMELDRKKTKRSNGMA